MSRILHAAVRAPAQHFERVLEECRPDDEIEKPADDAREQAHHDMGDGQGDNRRQGGHLHRITQCLRPAFVQGSWLVGRLRIGVLGRHPGSQ